MPGKIQVIYHEEKTDICQHGSLLGQTRGQAGTFCPVPKDAKPTESQKAYYARKYMEIHSIQSFKEKGPERLILSSRLLCHPR